MSEVKTLTISGSSSVNNGQYVRIEDYAVLKAERDALAAECSRLDRESQNLSSQLGQCNRERVAALAKLAGLEMVATLTLKDSQHEWERICYIPDGEHDLYIMKEDGE